MSICCCKTHTNLRVSTDEKFEEGNNISYMIRCCECGGKYGMLWEGTIYSYKNENDIIKKPIRYISKGLRFEVLKRQGWKCNICGVHLKYSKKHQLGEKVAHMDHVHPFSHWRTYEGVDINESSNLQALCPECNLKKNKKEIN